MVFAIIVLFQADIRRALAHFGRAPFFRYFERARAADETIEELVVAATHAGRAAASARSSCIERQIGLRNYIESGIPLDAMLTYDLLVEHLPAGVAAARRRRHHPGRSRRGGRLLSSADGESARRAASSARATAPRIGLTEENDAVAIVVSEETGAISLAIGGDLERGICRRRAARRGCATLLAIARRRDAPRPRRRGARSPDGVHRLPASLGLKVVSIALAALLWLAVAGEQTVERALRMPLEFTNLPSQLEIVGEPPTSSTSACAGRRAR